MRFGACVSGYPADRCEEITGSTEFFGDAPPGTRMRWSPVRQGRIRHRPNDDDGWHSVCLSIGW
jgi:hypothetical protein